MRWAARCARWPCGEVDLHAVRAAPIPLGHRFERRLEAVGVEGAAAIAEQEVVVVAARVAILTDHALGASPLALTHVRAESKAERVVPAHTAAAVTRNGDTEGVTKSRGMGTSRGSPIEVTPNGVARLDAERTKQATPPMASC